jgi:hypothetical protein
VLGKSYGSLVRLGHEQSKEFTGGANGGRLSVRKVVPTLTSKKR